MILQRLAPPVGHDFVPQLTQLLIADREWVGVAEPNRLQFAQHAGPDAFGIDAAAQHLAGDGTDDQLIRLDADRQVLQHVSQRFGLADDLRLALGLAHRVGVEPGPLGAHLGARAQSPLKQSLHTCRRS